jgi:serpin B
MAYAGARGQTASQLAKTLRLPAESVGVHSGVTAGLKDLPETDTAACQFTLANSLWAQRGYLILEPFRTIMRDQFGAGVNLVDFVTESPAVREQVDSWVAKETHGRILHLIPAGLPDATTRLLLVNAAYFKGQWAVPFRKARTGDAPFRLDTGESVSCRMMHTEAHFGYAENHEVQALSMPYVSHSFSFIVILPAQSKELPRLERGFTLAQFESLLAQMERNAQEDVHKVFVALPRFTCASQLSLGPTLEAMGVRDAFDPERADFSGVNGNRDLYLKAVLQKSSVAVDEAGTEAATATAAFTVLSGASKAFTADHPFLFLIVHKPSGAIMFMGRVSNPLAE